MDLGVRPLDWQGDGLLDEVETLFGDAAGAFVVGVYGAVAEVFREDGEAFEASRNGAALTLKTDRSALRLVAASYLAAFEIARPEQAPMIASAVPMGRVKGQAPGELTDLGSDSESLLGRDVGGRRFDLGLGRRAARFTIPCSEDLAQSIELHVGTPWPTCPRKVRMSVLAESPVRLVEAPCVRAEVDAVIPPPGGTSPAGSHTHLLPDHIAHGFDTPPTIPLPEGYVLSALFYPT